jgi:hypothetical protein
LNFFLSVTLALMIGIAPAAAAAVQIWLRSAAAQPCNMR